MVPSYKKYIINKNYGYKRNEKMNEGVKEILGYDPDELLGFDREALDRIFKDIENQKYI